MEEEGEEGVGREGWCGCASYNRFGRTGWATRDVTLTAVNCWMGMWMCNYMYVFLFFCHTLLLLLHPCGKRFGLVWFGYRISCPCRR